MGRCGDNVLLTPSVDNMGAVNDMALELQFKRASGCSAE